MGRWTGFLGILGLVLILFGIAGGFVVGSFTLPLILSHLGLGALLLIAWFITAGAKNLGQAGQVAVGRTARFSLNATVYTVVFVALLVSANWLVKRHDKRWDLTEEGVYSLSPQSVELIKNLKKPLKLVAFKGNENINDQEITQLFDLYRYNNDSKVSTELVNPRTKPHLVDAYGMKTGNIVYIEYGEGENKGVSRINELTEQAITNAVLKLTRGEAKKIYFIEGHGGPSLDKKSPQALTEFKAALGDEHLTVDGLFLAEKDAIPTDAAAVILVAPTKALFKNEKDALIKYADEGGRLLLFHDPQTSSDITEIAEHFGIQVDNDVMVDLVNRLFGAPALGVQLVTHDVATHPITKTMPQDSRVVFTLASSVRPFSEVSGKEASAQKDATYTDLIKSGPNAWGESNLSALFNQEEGKASLDPEDVKGPVPLAVAYEKKIGASDKKADAAAGKDSFENVSRVVVFGDADVIKDESFGLLANRDLILSTVNWLAGEEGGVTIGARSMRRSVAPISRDQFLLILGSSFLVPELLLVFGLTIWWRRKSVGLMA